MFKAGKTGRHTEKKSGNDYSEANFSLTEYWDSHTQQNLRQAAHNSNDTCNR